VDPVETGFNERVYEVVERVPAGRVTTYGDVATVLGNPRLARHVGWALARLGPDRSKDVPWQRVINAQGRISGRGEVVRADLQLALLQAEGVRFDEAGRCDLPAVRMGAAELSGVDL